MRSRHRQHQVHQHAAVQRKLRHRPLIHHLAHARVRRLQQLGRALGRYRLRIRPHRKRQVDHRLLTQLKLQRSMRHSKPAALRIDHVRARQQAARLIRARSVGCKLPRRIRRH